MPIVISANRLDDGTVAYYGADANWVRTLAAALPFGSALEAKDALAAAQDAVTHNLIVDPIVVEIAEAPAGRHALSLRNEIRAAGPTIKYAAAANSARS